MTNCVINSEEMTALNEIWSETDEYTHTFKISECDINNENIESIIRCFSELNDIEQSRVIQLIAALPVGCKNNILQTNLN